MKKIILTVLLGLLCCFFTMNEQKYKTLKVPFKSKQQQIQIVLEEEKSKLNEVILIDNSQTTTILDRRSGSSNTAKQIEQQPVIPFIISRQATATCAGDDGMPVLVSSLIFEYALLTAKTLKS